ncbi:MAG: dTMP kinase, partial [Aggregatilineales bacterium]
MTAQHFFLVIEGMDGSGKTEISRQLKRVLQQTHGANIKLSFEPHDPSSAGLYIRQVLTKRIKNVPPETLALAFALNRADHNNRVVNKFLRGDTSRLFISDRYYLSSLVYQATGSLTMDDVMWLNRHARKPDLTLFLRVSPHNAYARMRNRPQDKELFEQNLGERLTKYEQAMDYLRECGEPVLEIDANPDFETVLNSVLDTLLEHAPDWLRVQRPMLPAPEADFTLRDIEDATTLLKTTTDAYATRWQTLDGDKSALETIIKTRMLNTNYDTLAKLFIALLQESGYQFMRRLEWTDAHAWELHCEMPLQVKQRGAALLMGEAQRYDLVTRRIQELVDNASEKYLPEADTIRCMSDFMFVLDATPHHDLSWNVQRDSDG